MFHPSISKRGRLLFFPLIKICEFIGNHCPVFLIKVRYLIKFKRPADFTNPKTLNEKILYLKLFTDTSAWTNLADKYMVREYINQKGMSDILVTLYGHWYSVEDFKKDFATLPDSFILKANNGDGRGTNLVVKCKADYYDSSKFDELCELMQYWLSRKNIGALSAEPQYKNIKPCIVAEELLNSSGETSLTDYKVWCFNGHAYYIWVCSNRSKSGSSAEVLTYDRDWNPHPEYSSFTSDYVKGNIIQKPSCLDEMLSVAEQLSEGFPEVRVDLYNVNGKVFFGELTFTSQGGLMDFFTQEFQDKCGKVIKIPGNPKF